MLGFLVGVGLSLMPEDGAEAVRAELIDAAHHAVEERTVARERPSGSLVTYFVIVGMTSTDSPAGSH
ncbi:MAG: hypothetical protein JWQ42_2290 [Edaphobacter sp.]|nr:hypothetical protein [Edaphobacter sp.]